MSVDPRRPWPFTACALDEWFDELAVGGIFLTDGDLRVQAWNRWLEIHSGRRASEVNGQLLFDLYPELLSRGFDQYYRDALAGKARVVAYRFHGHLLPLPWRAEQPGGAGVQGLMAQTARIAPVRADGAVVGTITTIENVTERVNTERELRGQIEALERARAVAEAAVRTKDEFLATLSHELRTPLNAVLGWTRLMRSGQMDAAMVKRALEVVDRNATAQAQLIDDILDVARIMQGKLRLEMQPMDLVPVVLAAVDVIRPSADAKRVRVSTDVRVDEVAVVGDKDRLQQVAWNLLSNALKFTPTGGTITVRVLARGESAVVTIEDTGRGIAPEFLPYVFDRFRQEDSTTTRMYGGLGLGLALVRQIVDMHSGTVEAASEGEGRGSRFTVTLPLRTPIRARVAAPFEDEVHAAASQLEGRVVLVVEDEDDTREMLCAALGRAGATVLSAPSVREAFEIFTGTPAAGRAEIIIADIGLPAEDGYALLRRIRALDAPVPAIAVTGYAGPEDRERAAAAGFDRHFAKPVDPRHLVSAAAELLRHKTRP
ncbi:MAG: ATP-binding protein [Bacteroidales bacterium]